MKQSNELTFRLYSPASKNPDSVALMHLGEQTSYSDLHNECLGIAAHMISIGIKSGDKVALLCGNSPESVKLIIACWYAGAIPVPINTRNVPEEITAQVKFVEAQCVFYESVFEDKIDKTIDIKSISWPAEYPPGEFSTADIPVTNTALILFTSGTTGKLKAVMHSFETLYFSYAAINDRCNLQSEDRWLASLPFFHIGGFMILVRSLLSGCTLILPDSLKTADLIQTIEKHKPNYFSVVTTNFREMISLGLNPYPELKIIFLGGGPADPALTTSAIGNGWPVAQVYGSTETAAMVTFAAYSELRTNPGTAGKPLKGNEILIADNSGNEILIKSNSLFSKYFNNSEETADRLKNGYYHTGDIGYIDEAGYLFVESRREDLIISGGENVSADEVKNAIETHPGVAEAAVFALNDEKWGQKVAAAIVRKEGYGLDEGQINEFLKSKLAAFKIPKNYFFIPGIPRSPLGKIKIQELKKNLRLD